MKSVILSETIYADNLLSSVEIGLSAGDTAGEISWVDENQVIFAGQNTAEWKFVAEDDITYNEICGIIEFNAIEQQLVSLQIKQAPTKTNYVAFDEFDFEGVVVTATYDGGKIEDISSGLSVNYEKASSFRAGDTKVIIVYEDKSIE